MNDVLPVSIKGQIHPYPLISRGGVTVYRSKCRMINKLYVAQFAGRILRDRKTRLLSSWPHQRLHGPGAALTDLSYLRAWSFSVPQWRLAMYGTPVWYQIFLVQFFAQAAIW